MSATEPASRLTCCPDARHKCGCARVPAAQVVGGRHDQSVIVRVRGERAVDGRATAAALVALGIRTGDVTLVSGTRSRTKIVDIPDAALMRFEDLRDS